MKRECRPRATVRYVLVVGGSETPILTHHAASALFEVLLERQLLLARRRDGRRRRRARARRVAERRPLAARVPGRRAGRGVRGDDAAARKDRAPVTARTARDGLYRLSAAQLDSLVAHHWPTFAEAFGDDVAARSGDDGGDDAADGAVVDVASLGERLQARTLVADPLFFCFRLSSHLTIAGGYWYIETVADRRREKGTRVCVCVRARRQRVARAVGERAHPFAARLSEPHAAVDARAAAARTLIHGDLKVVPGTVAYGLRQLL